MNPGLKAFVDTVCTMSTQGHYDQLYHFCVKQMDALTFQDANLDPALAALDVNNHSIGVLTLLGVKIAVATCSDFEPLYQQIEKFISGCSAEQIHYASDLFADLCHYYTNSLVERRQALRGIRTLLQAIHKQRLTEGQLTSIHSDLCLLCLTAKCVKPALAVLETDVQDINKENGHFDVRYFLQYYYYGGMIYAVLKNFERAHYFFEVVVTTPSLSISQVVVEAYKKLVLISLILNGRVPVLPKYTSQMIARYVRPAARQYNELSNAYASNNVDELNLVISKYTDIYLRDTNMGLVKQCAVSLYKKNIQRLTKTFLTLSLNDMANRVQLENAEEAERYILKMIGDEQIFASINQKDGMVVFLDNPEKYNSPEMLSKLEDEMHKCIELDEKLRKMDVEISKNPKFIQKLKTESD